MDIPILLSQLGFTSSGFYDYENGNLRYQSLNGRYWSHTPFGKANAYHLAFDSIYLRPRSNNDRGIGYLLRCLAR